MNCTPGLLPLEQQQGGQLAHDRHRRSSVRSASRAGSLLVPEVDGDRAEVGAHRLRVARPQQPREAVDERGQPEVQHLEASVEVVLGGEVLGRNSIHLKMSQKVYETLKMNKYVVGTCLILKFGFVNFSTKTFCDI